MKSVNNSARIFFITCIVCIVPVVYAGCISLIEKGGQALDRLSPHGDIAPALKKIAVYQTEDTSIEVQEAGNKAGEHSLIILLEQFPCIQLYTSAPDNNGNFYLNALYYLGGSYHGWNEYRLDLSGSGTFTVTNNADVPTATLTITNIEPVEISAGRIRRYDTRITGAEALTGLRNRGERITALAEWMRGRDGVPPELDRDKFADYWKPLLFPEMSRKKHRPMDWRQEEDIFVKAEGIRWNSGYTERVFPEELRSVRNSGTMLRDWEEAFEWIYTEYNWNVLVQLLSQEIMVYKK